MTVHVIAPDSSLAANENLLAVPATIGDSPDNSWRADIRGGTASADAKNQAQIAIEHGNNILFRESNLLGSWLKQSERRRLTFDESLGRAGDTQLGVGFAVRHAFAQIEEFANSDILPHMVECEHSSSRELDEADDENESAESTTNVPETTETEAAQEQADGESEIPPVVFRIVRRSSPILLKTRLVVCGNLRDGDRSIQANGINARLVESVIQASGVPEERTQILLPDDPELQSDALEDYAEKNGAALVPVKTLDDVFRIVLRLTADEVYADGVVPICHLTDVLLAQYESLEALNEEFMDEYTVHVIRPGARLVCLENRRKFYEAQLKEMEAAHRANLRITPICDELRSILGKPGTNFGEDDVTPDSPLGEHDIDDDQDDDDGPAADPRAAQRRNDYEDDILLSDAKRRFKHAALVLEHPDNGGDAERFNLMKRRAEEDALLMQAYILRYWPAYIERGQKDATDIPQSRSRDDMADFDTVSQFLLQARQILGRLAERYRRRLTDSITVERILYEKNETNSIREEHEQIIAATRQIGRDIRRLLKDIRRLCAEGKRG